VIPAGCSSIVIVTFPGAVPISFCKTI
jgi:hypothetical protein